MICMVGVMVGREGSAPAMSGDGGILPRGPGEAGGPASHPLQVVGCRRSDTTGGGGLRSHTTSPA